ncbi:MAG: hypothetical protein IT370_35485 [Deltaproteobacteria bacterium]|nr:hypothetical protein [Deltaproteobacteria bacterium]
MNRSLNRRPDSSSDGGNGGKGNGNGSGAPRVLLSSPWFPEGYKSQAWDNPVTDFGDLQFTGHQDLFVLHGHMHELFAHVIGQNLRGPSVYLEYPRKEHFLAEVRKGYDFVGIHLFYNQVEATFDMCRAVRELSPHSKIVLGGYGALGIAEMVPPGELKPLADYLCLGEGIGFMRKLLGEPADAPIEISHMPRGGVTLPWQKRYITNEMGVVVASLGCPYGCDFCGTTKMFNRRRLVLVPPRKLAAEIVRIYEEDPRTMLVAVYEEDSFLDHEYLEEVGEHLRASGPGLAAAFWVLGGIKSIHQWGEDRWRRIARTGVASAFLGVESKFAEAEGYVKRAGDTREVFDQLHAHGITTTGAWVCGWDFHTRENVQEDLAFFLSLKPTMHQLTTLCPFPGTDLFRRLRKEGRVPENLRWQDLSFFGAGGGVKYKNFEAHEIMELVHSGYRKSYELWGPSLMRTLEVALNGYEWCRASGDQDLYKKANFHRRQILQMYPLLPTAIEFAPNGFVRRWLRELDARYRRVIGEPASIHKVMAALVLEKARHERKQRQASGRDRHVQIPDPRAVRYDFAGYATARPGERPYVQSFLEHDRSWERFRRAHNAGARVTSVVNEAARLYDHLRRRTRPDREAVDEAARLIATFSVPLT